MCKAIEFHALSSVFVPPYGRMGGDQEGFQANTYYRNSPPTTYIYK